MHAAVLEVPLNFPAAHAVHGPVIGPSYPGSQTHPVPSVLDQEKAKQFKHVAEVDAPNAVEYFPVEQKVHVLLPCEVL